MATNWNLIPSFTRRCVPIELHKYNFPDRTIHKCDFIEPDTGEKWSAQFDPSSYSSFPIGIPGDYIFKIHFFGISNCTVPGRNPDDVPTVRTVPSYSLLLVGGL